MVIKNCKKMKMKSWLCRLSILGTITLIIFSCEKNKNDIPTGVRTALVYTSAPKKVRQDFAVVGGYIIENGGGPITERGIIYGANPELNDDTKLGKVIDNTSANKDTGSFEVQINGLTAGNVYYARTYAINSAGMNLGNKITVITKTAVPPGGIADIEGNVYHVDTIGTQIWLRENLVTTLYNDETPIPQVQDAGAWGTLKTGCYAIYEGKVENALVYGNLYNWHAVNTGKLAPKGWHVPSREEWKTLINYLGGNSVAGGKAKEAGTTHWPAPNTGATNESGFTALPAGFFYPGAGFIGLGSNAGGLALFHTSSAHTGNEDIYSDRTQLATGSASFDELYWIQEAGASVRCIKD
jgi:uncharacterized protein (TIGR02145 family)